MPSAMIIHPLKSKKRREDNRVGLHRALARALAIGLISIPLGSEALGQSLNAPSNRGDIPASPWANRSRTSGLESENTVRSVPSDVVRQPRNANSRFSATAEDDEVAPSPVTLFGPIATPQKTSEPALKNAPVQESASGKLEFPAESRTRSSTRKTLSYSAATPSHALTQKTPIDAQSDWHRVPAGGLVQEPGPSGSETGIATRRGLPDRDETSSKSQPQSRMASNSSTRNADPIQLGAPHGQANEIESEPQATSVTVASRPRLPAYETPLHDTDSTRSVRDATNDAIVGMQPQSRPDREFDEAKSRRVDLAQRVSTELLSSSTYPASRAPEMLEALPGWQAIEQDLKERLERCDSLLKRGAVHSAREESAQGLRRLFRTMDAYRKDRLSETALDKALIALREEFDFHDVRGTSRPTTLAEIVASHTTDALKGRPLANVSSEIAAQHYRMYARYEFLVAADGHRWASDLLYAYGKTLEKEAEQDSERATTLRSQAVVCYQAASQVAPTQSEVTNQLGYALIQLDRTDEAYQALAASLQNKPTANAWSNLAELYRRRGASSEADFAVQKAKELAGTETKYTFDNPQVVEVEPSVFAKYSPMPNVGTQQTNGYTGVSQPSSPQRNASNSSGFLSKIFR